MKGYLLGAIAVLLVAGALLYGSGAAEHFMAPAFPTIDAANVFPPRPVGVLTLLPGKAALIGTADGDSYVLYYHQGALHVWVNTSYAGKISERSFMTLEQARDTDPSDAPMRRFKDLSIVFVALDARGRTDMLIAGLVFEPALFDPKS